MDACVTVAIIVGAVTGLLMRNRWGLAGGRLILIGLLGGLPGGIIAGLLVGSPIDVALNNGALIIAVWLAWFGALGAVLTARPRKATPP